MEVSIRGSKPDGSYGIRPQPFFALVLLITCLGSIALPVSNAHGFSLRSTGGGLERLRPGDVLQGGAGLGGAAEQTFDQGSIQSSLVDIAQPLELNLGGLAIGSLSANIVADRAFDIRLTGRERRDCLTDTDFDIQVRIISPGADTLGAQGASGGQLQVVRFEPELRRGGGGRGGGRGRCSNRLRFGYELDLLLDGAVAAGVYEGLAEFTVTGPGGATDTLQVPVRVEMPGLLLLYYYSQINVDLQAAAIAGALGADSACSGGFCMDVGSRALTLGQLGVPVAMDVGAAVPAFNPVQTITLRNAVGVRATGCSGDVFDTASYQVFSSGGGIQQTTGIISAIDSQPCGLDMRTGDLSFDLDLTQVNGTTARASATIEITVTGL